MINKYREMIQNIDNRISGTTNMNIPLIFKDIPLSLFAELSLQEQNEFLNIKKFFPLMANDTIQKNWTGNCGHELLKQTIRFVEDIINYYIQTSGSDDLSKLNFLDFGCG